MRLANLTGDPITLQTPPEDGWFPEEWICEPGNWLNIEDDEESPIMGRLIQACVRAGLTPLPQPPAYDFVPA